MKAAKENQHPFTTKVHEEKPQGHEGKQNQIFTAEGAEGAGKTLCDEGRKGKPAPPSPQRYTKKNLKGTKGNKIRSLPQRAQGKLCAMKAAKENQHPFTTKVHEEKPQGHEGKQNQIFTAEGAEGAGKTLWNKAVRYGNFLADRTTTSPLADRRRA